MDALTQPGTPSAVRQTANKNGTLIIAAGTPSSWTVSYGGGLGVIGLSEGELVGEDPRPIFEASGPDALRAFEDITEGRRTLVKFRGVYPTPDGSLSAWDCVMSKNGEPGNWNFVATLVPPDERADVVHPDAKWYERLFRPAARFLSDTSIGKLVTLTLCACLLYGTWAWWNPSGIWRDAFGATKQWFDVRRVEALARIEEARAAQARDGVAITVEDGASVTTDEMDAQDVDVEADQVNLRSGPDTPSRPPSR